MFYEAKNSFAHHGIKVSDVSVDLPAMMKQKEGAVTSLTKGIEGLFKKNKVTYVKGHGKLTGPNEVTVDLLEGGQQVVRGKNIVIATGSYARSLPGAVVDEKKVVSSTGALSLEKIPEKMVVIGECMDVVDDSDERGEVLHIGNGVVLYMTYKCV